MSARDLVRRGSALFLAGLFVAGELGWSGLDALVFHTAVHHRQVEALGAAAHPPSGQLRAAIQAPRGTEGDHAAHCVLGLSTGSARASVPVALDVRPEPAVALRREAAGGSAGWRAYVGTLARPRAPPSPLA